MFIFNVILAIYYTGLCIYGACWRRSQFLAIAAGILVIVGLCFANELILFSVMIAGIFVIVPVTVAILDYKDGWTNSWELCCDAMGLPFAEECWGSEYKF